MSSAVPVSAHYAAPAIARGFGDSCEVEVKFVAENTALADVTRATRSAVADASVRTLVSIYFDTPGDDLRRSGHTLRIRRAGDATPVMSVKSSALAEAGPFQRHEVEVPVPGGLPDPSLLPAGLRSVLLAAAGGQPLLKRFETRVQRTVMLRTHRASVIEIASDVGEIIAGGQTAPLSELELELKSGKVDDLLDFASSMAGQAGLRLDFVSKSERGFRLALGLQSSPAKALSLAIPPDASAGEAMVAILANSLAHFVANWDGLRHTTDPECIHQMRVSLRRMRSALGLFRPAFAADADAGKFLEELRARAKRIASALGPAREYDVFLDMAAHGPLRSPDCPGGGEALLAIVRERQAAAYAAARQVIDSADAARFVFDIQAGIACPPDGADVPARAFAAKALARLDRRAEKRGADMPNLDDDARHDLRIALKNLRYGAEFFEGLFGRHKKARAFGKAVASLQDLLGAHNDVITARRVVDEIASSPDRQAAAAAAYVLGWFARGVPMADEVLKDAWRDFRHAPRYWG